MAVKIRLKRMGTKRKPHFKIIVCDQSRPRDTKAIEELGFYELPDVHCPYARISDE